MYDWRVRALMTWIEKNKDAEGNLSMDKLSSAGHLDQYHYLGLACKEEVIKILGLKPGMKILDVGCGIGGPARYLAWKSGCSITGADIQDQLVEAGNAVTKMVQLDSLVNLVAGDVCDSNLFEESTFDAFISLLVILHIEDRARLFASLMRANKAGGGFLIEDMVALDPAFSADETRIAQQVIGAPYLPTIDEYRQHLETAGFVDVEFESLTPEWVRWCIDRSDQYMASKEEQIRVHGEKTFAQRSSFYADVKQLFLSGKLGGVRITGRKPTQVELAIRAYRASPNGLKKTTHNVSSILERNG